MDSIFMTCEQCYAQRELESFIALSDGPVRSWEEWVGIAQKVLAVQKEMRGTSSKRLSAAQLVALIEGITDFDKI